jgi:P pilus assembly chaperone PapD
MGGIGSRSLDRASADYRGRVRGTVLALCAAGTLFSQRSAAQLLIDPLELTIPTGGSIRTVSSISVINTSNQTVEATISRSGWDRKEDGANRFFAGGENSCGQILSFSPLSVRVEPQSSRIVRLTIETNAPVTRECSDIIFIEEIPRHSATKVNSLEFIFRTGVKVYVDPPGLTPNGVVEKMVVVDSRQIALWFHNTGSVHLVAKGRLVFRRLDNSSELEIPIEEFPTLPGAVRRVLLEVPVGLPVGDYLVLALIDFGGADLVAGQIEFHAK